jgi:hypothetical protein
MNSHVGSILSSNDSYVSGFINFESEVGFRAAGPAPLTNLNYFEGRSMNGTPEQAKVKA